jgi:hypothetical protein
MQSALRGHSDARASTPKLGEWVRRAAMTLPVIALVIAVALVGGWLIVVTRDGLL